MDEQYTLTVRFPAGSYSHEQYGLDAMRVILAGIADRLNVLSVGETVEIKRIA